jgi:glycosyltransferase involved in cell wall biosynthesis
VLTSQQSNFNKALEAAGVKTVVVHHGAFLVPRPAAAWKIPVKYLIFLVKYIYGLVVSVKLAESAIDFDDIDLVHTNVPRNDLGAILAKRHNIPHIVHLRECSFSHFRCWSYRRDPVKYLNLSADAFIAVSGFVGKYWESLGLSKEKMYVVYNGVTPPRRAVHHSIDTRSENRALRIIFLGGYVEAKGIWDAVRAMLLVQRDYPDKVILDIYGGGSQEVYRAVLRYLEDNGLQNVIYLHGPLDNVWPEIETHDIGLACSMDEAFGRIVTEYQSCGTVPIVSNSGAFPELVQDGVSGLVYEKAEGGISLAERVICLLKNPRLINALSEGAFERSEKFTAERNCAGVQEVYDKVLSMKSTL